jgi:hypothetical protein
MKWIERRLMQNDSGFNAGAPAALTLHFFITQFDQAFAFAICTFHFFLAGTLLHNSESWLFAAATTPPGYPQLL